MRADRDGASEASWRALRPAGRHPRRLPRRRRPDARVVAGPPRLPAVPWVRRPHGSPLRDLRAVGLRLVPANRPARLRQPRVSGLLSPLSARGAGSRVHLRVGERSKQNCVQRVANGSETEPQWERDASWHGGAINDDHALVIIRSPQDDEASGENGLQRALIRVLDDARHGSVSRNSRRPKARTALMKRQPLPPFSRSGLNPAETAMYTVGSRPKWGP
jgi:hypothetical protein